jgi:membrane protein DedA with SNARE-associated domain
MLWTIVVFAAGWWVGRNWDFVKKMYHEKVTSKQNSSGNVTKVD